MFNTNLTHLNWGIHSIDFIEAVLRYHHIANLKTNEFVCKRNVALVRDAFNWFTFERIRAFPSGFDNKSVWEYGVGKRKNRVGRFCFYVPRDRTWFLVAVSFFCVCIVCRCCSFGLSWIGIHSVCMQNVWRLALALARGCIRPTFLSSLGYVDAVSEKYREVYLTF